MRDYKIDDWVIYIDKENSNKWKKEFGISLYGKIAKIIYFYFDSTNNNYNYVLEFKESIRGKGEGIEGHCNWCNCFEFKSIDHLKFKKWVKG